MEGMDKDGMGKEAMEAMKAMGMDKDGMGKEGMEWMQKARTHSYRLCSCIYG